MSSQCLEVVCVGLLVGKAPIWIPLLFLLFLASNLTPWGQGQHTGSSVPSFHATGRMPYATVSLADQATSLSGKPVDTAQHPGGRCEREAASGRQAEPSRSNPAVHQAVAELDIRPSLGSQLAAVPLCCPLTGHIITSLLQVRETRLRRPACTCLEIIQLVGDGDTSQLQVS